MLKKNFWQILLKNMKPVFEKLTEQGHIKNFRMYSKKKGQGRRERVKWKRKGLEEGARGQLKKVQGCTKIWWSSLKLCVWELQSWQKTVLHMNKSSLLPTLHVSFLWVCESRRRKGCTWGLTCLSWDRIQICYVHVQSACFSFFFPFFPPVWFALKSAVFGLSVECSARKTQ